MGLTQSAEVTEPFKLFTAIGFGVEKPATDALLNHARDLAYTSRTTVDVTLNQAGEAVVDATTDGVKQAPLRIGFAHGTQTIGTRMGIGYDVTVNHPDGPSTGRVDLTSPLIGKGETFNIQAYGQVISGKSKTEDGISNVSEAVADAAGNLIFKGVSQSDLTANPAHFNRTSIFTDADGRQLGSISQVIDYDAKAKTIHIESVARGAGYMVKLGK